MPAPEVLVVGSLHYDIVMHASHLPARDETVAGTEVAYVCGGKGGNQAVAAAHHGARTAMIGRVGDDAQADVLLTHLADAGVDPSGVQRGAGASGMSVAIVEKSGDYGAVIVSGANLALDATGIAVPEGTRVVLLQNEIPEACNLDAARKARGAGATVVLNAAPARPLPPDLVALVDFLVVNCGEAATLVGHAVAPPDDAVAAAETLAAGTRTALVSLGAEGVAVCNGRGPGAHCGAFPVDARSTHGAGDVLVGALASGLCQNTPLDTALRYAQAAAALHVSAAPDGQPIRRADVQAFLAGR